MGKRIAVSTLVATIGFTATFALHQATAFYFTSIVVVTIILVALYGGSALAFVFAVMLSLAADYFFIPPTGAVLNSSAGWQHFMIMMSIAFAAALVSASFRIAFRQTIAAKREAESAKRRAEASSSSMERMLALVSHDVRNPLSTVKMAATLLFDGSVAGPQAGELRAMITRNLEQVDSMIQSLLDVERIRAGKSIPLDFRTCDLAGEVQRFSQPMSDRVRVVASEPILGLWGVSGIQRAIQNLVSNALKYGAPGTPIEVVLRRRGAFAIVSVHNEGRTISERDREQLFHPFERTDAGEKSGVKGWGLGLALVRAIAEAHGGAATVESSADAGTTFALEMPIRVTAAHVLEPAHA
jgi:signal transduction histidine kinase